MILRLFDPLSDVENQRQILFRSDGNKIELDVFGEVEKVHIEITTVLEWVVGMLIHQTEESSEHRFQYMLIGLFIR